MSSNARKSQQGVLAAYADVPWGFDPLRIIDVRDAKA